MRNSAGGLQHGRAAPASPRPHPNPLPAGEGARLPRARAPAARPSLSLPRGDRCVTRRAGFSMVARPPPPPALTPTLSQREREQDLPASAHLRRAPSLSLPQRGPLRNSAGGLQQGRAAIASPHPHPNPLPAGEGVEPPAPARPRTPLISVFPRGDRCVTRRAGFSMVARPRLPPPSPQPSPSGRGSRTSPRPRTCGARPLSVSPRGGRCVTRRAGFSMVARPRLPPPSPQPSPSGRGSRTSPRPRTCGARPLSVSPRGGRCVTRRAGFSMVARPPPPPALTPTLSQREREQDPAPSPFPKASGRRSFPRRSLARVSREG